MEWQVTLRRKVIRQLKRLPDHVRNRLIALMKDIECFGPIRGDWPNYGQLSNNRYHCHLKKGHPTYVAVWKVADKEIRLVEVTYAGTHEKAPY